MRLKGGHEDINYDDTKSFFKKRADKYNEANPYSVTMYQDDNPELVKQRNAKEVEKLLPFLRLDNNSKLLDIACGIGRWSDAITVDINMYCGIDYCEEFIIKAQQLNSDKHNRFFYVGACSEISQCLLMNNKKDMFNRILLMGILLYLNDEDVKAVFGQISEKTEEHAIVIIRVPIAIDERLTLKEHFSEELDDNYNAIYRTRDEMIELMTSTLLQCGFGIKNEGFLYEDILNNRKETAQYYFVLER